MVTAVTVSPGNEHDGHHAAGLVEQQPVSRRPERVIGDTAYGNPANVEKRDYLQVETDAWNARTRIGGIPVTIISDASSEETIKAAMHHSERRGLRRNVADQQGWLVLSPRARQIVVHTRHAVEEADPDLVIDAILDVVKESR